MHLGKGGGGGLRRWASGRGRGRIEGGGGVCDRTPLDLGL